MTQKLKLNSPVGADPLILKWPIPTSEGKDGPEEILDTIKLLCEDYPELKIPLETRILKDGEDVSAYDYEQTKAMCERYNKAIDSLRQLVKSHPRQKTVPKQASMKQLKHILQQCYNHSVKDPEKLNHYEPFSPEVYGETSFELVEQMIKYVKFSECDYFIDLGSGVGQVVLQVSAATNCKFCYGVEKAEWPAEYAMGMEKEFKKWMKWYGKEHGEFKIEKGDFLHDSIREKLSNATIVFVNNFAFGPVVDHELKQRFANCLKEGARIVSSKAFCPLNFRITARNLSDIGTIMQVEELSPLCGAVSWTGKPFAYYVHTIDRTLLEKYFQRLRHPSKKDEVEPRKDRKGRPLLSIKDKINGALSGGSDSNSSGRCCRLRGLQREVEPVTSLSAAKVLDFDSGSNSSCTNSGGAPAVDDNSIVYGPTTRRQWNEYVKRPQSQSGTENENDSSTADIAPMEVKTKDQAKQITQKKKKMKTVKRLNNGALGKRQMQVGKKCAEPPSSVKSKAAVKLRPRQRTRSSVPKKAAAASAASTTTSVTTTSNTVSSNVSAHLNGTVLPPSLDSLNLLHAHTIMSTSGKDPTEKVSYNDRRMTETSNAYFKPTIQKQTVSMLEKEAGFLHMIETMKQRFLSFLTFMQTPEYRAMLLLQIEQEKRKNTTLKGQTANLEKDISILQKEGVRLIKDRLKEMGIRADTPRELISQAKDIMLRHHELKSQTASLGAQINALQTEHNHKITAYRKALDRKIPMQQTENGFCEQNYNLMYKDRRDHHRLLANVNRLCSELQHLQNVNKPYVVTKLEGSSNLDVGLNLAAESKGVVKGNGTVGRPPQNAYTVKEKMDMKENYEAFGTVLAMVKKELTADLQIGNTRSQSSAQTTKSEAQLVDSYSVVSDALVDSERQEMAERAQTVSVSLKTNSPATEESFKSSQSNSGQSFKSPETLVKVVSGRGTNVSQMSSSWTSDVRKDGAVTSTSPRILPAGMKIDIRKPTRMNGLNTALKAKVSNSGSYTLLQNPDNFINQNYKLPTNASFNTVPTYNLYTENEKSAAEDLISLKDILSTPTIEAQSSVVNKVPASSKSLSSFSGMEYVQSHVNDLKTSNRQHSCYDNMAANLVANKPHTGSSSSNSLSKESSASCAISPSSTSHVFAQVPVASLSQSGSSGQFTNQNNQVLGTVSSGLKSSSQNKMAVLANLPKNGLVKHKNYDASLIQRPVKVRTLDIANELNRNVPLVVPSSFRTQPQQQTQIVQASSSGHATGTSLTQILKSEPSHLSQSFLNAHMSQTVVVSSCSSVGSTTLPFVTIQSPHAMPVSQGSNGVQPSLLKILQQKPLVITPKSSTVFNGGVSSSSTGGLIAVSPSLTSQGTDSLGQAVKIMPSNGRDTKGGLRSPEPSSLVVSEFVPVASPDLVNSNHAFQGCQQHAVSSDCHLKSASSVIRDVIQIHNNCAEKRGMCSCYSTQLGKGHIDIPMKVCKLSSCSDICCPDNLFMMAQPSHIPVLDYDSVTAKEHYDNSCNKKCGSNLSVRLKREAKLEKMAEWISDNESRNKGMAGTESDNQVYSAPTSFNLIDCESDVSSTQLDRIKSPKVFEESVRSKNVVGEIQASGAEIKLARHKSAKADHPQSIKLRAATLLLTPPNTLGTQETTSSPFVTDKMNENILGPDNVKPDINKVHNARSQQQPHKHSLCKSKYDKKCESTNKPVQSACRAKIAAWPLEIEWKSGGTSKKVQTNGEQISTLNENTYPTRKSSESSHGTPTHSSERKVDKKRNRHFSQPRLMNQIFHRHSICKSQSHRKICSNLAENCHLSLNLEKSKLNKHHSSSQKHTSHSSTKTCEYFIMKPDDTVRSHKGKTKTKPGHQRRHEKSISSSGIRTQSHEERLHRSLKDIKKHSLSKQKDQSPGPPKLERAVSPPSLQAKHKITTINPETCSSMSDSDPAGVDWLSKLCGSSSEKHSSDHRRSSKLTVSSRHKEKIKNVEPCVRSRDFLVSCKLGNSFPKTDRHSIKHKAARNSKSGTEVSGGETKFKGTDLECFSKTRSKRLYEKHAENVKPHVKERSASKISPKSRRKLELKCGVELNKEVTSAEICNSSQSKNLTEHFQNIPNVEHSKITQGTPQRQNEQGGSCVKDSLEKMPEPAFGNEEPVGDLFSANLDSTYGMLTPKSISHNGPSEDDKNTDSCRDENIPEENTVANKFGFQEFMLNDYFSKDSLESHAEHVTTPAPETELFPFPPTPGKTPHSSFSLPCSPCTEVISHPNEEHKELVTEEMNSSCPFVSVSSRKGPQTPPGSPLFSHPSQLRSRSPSASSSSSRGSSCDSCRSTSSSSSFSGSSSDDTKWKKRRTRSKKTTPPRKLSTLIIPTCIGLGSPPKAAVQYSPMPSPNMSGFNYGVPLRVGLSTSSIPGFNNHGIVVGTSVLSPLSVSTQQSPGYQMVTSDSLRSPSGLIRSPVSGGLHRQHSFFPHALPSPVLTVSAVTVTSTHCHATMKDSSCIQSCRLVSSHETYKSNKYLESESVDHNQDGAESSLLCNTKVLSGSLVKGDSHMADLGTESSKTDTSIPFSQENSFKLMNSIDIVKDHNANNTSLNCTHSHLQETLESVDCNQNLCHLSSCCAAAIHVNSQNISKTSIASEFSASSTTKLKSQLASYTNSDSAVVHTEDDHFASMVMEKKTLETSCLAAYQPPNECRNSESFARKNESEDFPSEPKTSKSFLSCSLQQSIQYQPLPSTDDQSKVRKQNRQQTPLTQPKHQPLLTQPLQQSNQHYSLHNSSPPLHPHHLLHAPKHIRQKNSLHSSYMGHYNVQPHHSYKGHSLGGRRPTFVSQMTMSPQYPPPWGHTQPYSGPFYQNGPPYINRPRHTLPSGPPPRFRDTSDCSLMEHMHSGIMEYPPPGTLTHPPGSGQWEHPAPPYCMGLGSGGLGRSFHQHYNHLYHNKYHH